MQFFMKKFEMAYVLVGITTNAQSRIQFIQFIQIYPSYFQVSNCVVKIGFYFDFYPPLRITTELFAIGARPQNQSNTHIDVFIWFDYDSLEDDHYVSEVYTQCSGLLLR